MIAFALKLLNYRISNPLLTMKFPKLSFWLFIVVLICGSLGSCSNKKQGLFEQLSSKKTGITFNNQIVENDSINPIDLTNVYNGAGIGAGDFNNDGLIDLYFAGNMVSNKLYLNQGDFEFEDITHEAGVDGKSKWCRGVSVIDINNDGLLDIYVSATILSDADKRRNLLYVNQGLKDKIPTFREMAGEYGLADSSHTTMAYFFDYDNDGDLDVYLAVNEILKSDNPSTFRPRLTDGSHPSTGKLFRNDPDASKKHPVFSDVSRQAGITMEGYTHAASVADFNHDGWKDLFITNDFLGNDILFINNQDGTFTERTTDAFKHTSANGMGQDVIDINNDGLADVVELDMNPEDNFRKKMMMNGNSYQQYQNYDYYKYQYQYVRNTLQLNLGTKPQQDAASVPVFGDIAYFAGIAETDWSWTPIVQDFDNDGARDIIITNGFPKDVTDHDFIMFRRESFSIASKEYTLSQIPQVKLANYAYRNNGDLTFSNVTQDWGLQEPTFANAGIYADLDNDGDMDLVISNINDEASVYRNTAREKNNNQNFLQFRLHGAAQNLHGIGAIIELHYANSKQVYENSPYRGYLSTVQMYPHFGLGKTTSVDSVVIIWDLNKRQVLKNVACNKIIDVYIKDALQTTAPLQQHQLNSPLFQDVTKQVGIDYIHSEQDYVDFNVQKLLPHKFSEFGPSIATGDINNDGLDDMVVAGARFNSAQIFTQRTNGTFAQTPLLSAADAQKKESEDHGLLLFDADNDKDLDLLITSGGFEHKPQSPNYADHLYINDGKGNFALSKSALPENTTSKSCARAADFDRDGDLDLFIGGRVLPEMYPTPVSSFIYRNDGKAGFVDVTKEIAPGLHNIGMISDAIWTDFDNDGWLDIMLAGEWMPVKFLKNVNGKFEDISATTGLQNYKGWWNSLAAADFDNDGDMDYVAGNLGLNSFYDASEKEPVRIYAKDFDKNGSFDAIPSVYLPVSAEDKTRKEFPAHTRDDLVKQMISFRAKFQNYKQYASATFDQLFKPEDLKDALVLEANFLKHAFIRNNGNGKFEMIALPSLTQLSCINGMVVTDVDSDGQLDIVATGNDYGTEVSIGRYDACNGLVMKGDGKGSFKIMTMAESGIFIPGNARGLARLTNKQGDLLLAASQNRGPLKIFARQAGHRLYPASSLDAAAEIKLSNGKTITQELHYGQSFMSQGGRYIEVPSNATAVTIRNSSGEKRTLTLN